MNAFMIFLTVLLTTMMYSAIDRIHDLDANPSRNLCGTFECRIRIDSLVRQLDRSIDPCDNFYDYVCHKPDSVYTYNTFSRIEHRIGTELQAFFDSDTFNLPSNETSIRRMKSEYETCTAQHRKQTSGWFDRVVGWLKGDDSETRHECYSKITTEYPAPFSALYVKYFFDGRLKTIVDEIVPNLIAVYEDLFRANTWIDYTSRDSAIAKLYSMRIIIGYPDTLMKYYNDTKIIDKRYRTELEDHEMKFISGLMHANAFYYVRSNTVVIPAAILQRELFTVDSLPATVYATIGRIIAHEISHAFDKHTIEFDKRYETKFAWYYPGIDQIRKRFASLEQQYGRFVEPISGIQLQPRRTIDDDVADNNGVLVAYLAWQRHLKKTHSTHRVGNVTRPLFWLSYAQSQCQHFDRDEMARYVIMQEHSPPQFRVNVPLQNSYAFARDFNCSATSHMNPPTKITILTP